ncbi:MAG TPA: chemotaxis protein CheA [Bryobacteraceae bacterium]|nr:chemotaxis protein CheA [Bryobacteraceae bacterium]
MPQSAGLRRQIEDLALKLVIGEPESCAEVSDWLTALARLQQTAQEEKSTHVALAAGDVIDALRKSEAGEHSNNIADRLQEGIARLQQVVECEAETPSADLSPAQDPELLGDFLLESREHLTEIEAQALIIERDPHNADALNSVFRGFHTIKGLAGFLELWAVQELAHDVEAILDRARNGQLTITPGAIDVILQGADYLRRWLSYLDCRLQNRPADVPGIDQGLLSRIRALAAPEPGVLTSAIASLASAVADEKVTAIPDLPPDPKPSSSNGDSGPAKLDHEEAVPASAHQAPTETRTVKVDTGKLDYLVDMAGEMVIAESLVRHDPELTGLKSPKLQRKIAQLTRITSELQRTAMSMRLVPIGPLFHRMARLVRDLARQFGKRVEMETSGDEIELDRTIVEELADPLMHMVRNALDHGIESPQDRDSRGKPATARLLLKAQHQAGQVVIEVTDDGRGLDREKIAAKAAEKGLISSIEGVSDTEVYNLIFLPGFSTATQVTNVSGRGVGMDVVRRHIEKLRGRIEIRSSAGSGSTFLMKLPLTLAIIDGLVVSVGPERYIVPLFAVREMFRPAQETIWTVQQRGEMALVRGSLLPLYRLHRRFNVTPRTEDPLQSVLVVAEVEGQRFCLMVDELIGKQEVVIKSLGETFRHVAGIAGGAILGDGRVGLILDLDRLFKDKGRD